MVKILVLIVVVFVLFAVENGQVRRGKEPTSYTRAIKVAHVACGVLVTALATAHGIARLGGAGAASLVTGVAALALLYAELATGAYLAGKKEAAVPAARTAHKLIPLAAVCVLVLHVLARALA